MTSDFCQEQTHQGSGAKTSKVYPLSIDLCLRKRIFHKLQIDSKSSFTVDTRYQQLSKIGHGSYGVVCGAKDVLTGGSCAIKKISNVFGVLLDAKRALREIKLLTHLRGTRGVVDIIDVEVEPAYSMKFTSLYVCTRQWPCDLDKIIFSTQDLSVEHIRAFAYQSALAINHLHSAGIMHRDLKPSNILVRPDCSIALCDFGLARGFPKKAAEFQIQAPKVDVADMNIGASEYVVTRWYRAPELLLDCSSYGFSVDMWSFGCIIGELFARTPLFQGTSKSDQLRQILNLIGKPDFEELEYLHSALAMRLSSSTREFSKSDTEDFLRRKRRETGVHSNDVTVDRQMISLIDGLLVFDSRSRLDVHGVLNHRFLSSCREPELEQTSGKWFDSSFEKHCSSKKNLERLILSEHFSFHPEDREFFAQKIFEKFSEVQTEEENADPNQGSF